MKFFIMAHAEATPVLLRALPFFKRIADVVILSPLDSPVNLPGIECRYAGASSYSTTPCEFSEPNTRMLTRLAAFMDIALEYDTDYYIITDYDQMWLRPPVGLGPGVTCCRLHKWLWENSHCFHCDYFPSVPYIFSRFALAKAAASCRKYINAQDFEHGWLDRWLAVVLERENISVTPLIGGFSAYRTDPAGFECQKAFYAGAMAANAVCLHPIKSQAEWSWCAAVLKQIDPHFHATLEQDGLFTGFDPLGMEPYCLKYGLI